MYFLAVVTIFPWYFNVFRQLFGIWTPVYIDHRLFDFRNFSDSIYVFTSSSSYNKFHKYYYYV